MKKSAEKTLAKITWKAIEIVAFIATIVPFIPIEIMILKGLASRGMEFGMLLVAVVIIGIILTLVAGLAYGLVLWAISSMIQKIRR